MAPRPTSRASTTDRGTGPGPRPLVRGYASERAYGIELDVRTAYDFVLSMAVKGDDDLLPEDRLWLAEARNANSDLLNRSVLFGAEGHKGMIVELSVFLADRPDVRTAADVVRLVADTPPAVLLRRILGDLCDDFGLGDVVDRVFAGESGALEEFDAAWARTEDDVPVGDLLRNIDASVADLRAATEAWLKSYQAVEPRIRRLIELDAETRRVDLATLDPTDAIERMTGGLRWLPEPGTRRLILAPAYFGRPYNWLFQGPGWRTIAYPIADAVLDTIDRSAPPQAAVRFYRALGDETRLRILRLLVDRDLYLTELAQLLELSKPTVKHHLTLLRAAGLLTITDEGGLTYYSLRRGRVEEAGPELQRFLGV